MVRWNKLLFFYPNETFVMSQSAQIDLRGSVKTLDVHFTCWDKLTPISLEAFVQV